jgi:hypothetical protein
MDMNERIRTQFPAVLAEAYQEVDLATNPQIKVQRWVDFFEETVRFLSLVGLAFYRQRGLSDKQVQEVRKGLYKPSLGHWVKLFRALEKVLMKARIDGFTPPLNQKHQNNPIEKGVNQLKKILGNEPLPTVRLLHFLKTMVEFRNKKIGHGSMSTQEARQALESIRPAMLFWLEKITILEEWYLLYINRVEWKEPNYILTGTRNRGTSLYNARIVQREKVSGQQAYLAREREEASPELLSLHPFLAFDDNDKLFLVYTELSSSGHPLLKCTYKTAYSSKKMELEDQASSVLGEKEEQDLEEEPVSQPEPEAPTEERTLKDAPMKPWYELITPHEDIRTGNLDEAIFHADLGDVARNKAPDDYLDAYLFYKKTYLTHGLENLLNRVHTTLTEGKGSSVVQIQTPFGGGKTHSLVAIYHYLKNSAQIKELLPPGVPPMSAPLSAISGNHWNPVEGITTEGINRKTFWGEMAYQIGGKEGYEEFREDDEMRISPGKEKIQNFLEKHQPFVLLFDEILEYINRALDVKHKTKEKTGVSLGTQTFSFFQELTEAVSLIPRGMMVVTLPSSYLEDFSDQTEESLARLGKIFGRLESIETPVHGEEIYEIIRRRLFDIETLKKGDMRAVVHRYFQTYKNNHDDLPVHVRDMEYRQKMELAFPFHLSVIDILNEKWSTYPTFQRTRGVLRLLANVVEDLYQREVSFDLILPGDVNLDHPSIRREFMKHIGPEYEGVIGSDIAGHDAKAQMMDNNNRNWNHLAERISTAIFYHSFSADDAEKGVNLLYIKLATMRSDTIPPLVTDILQRLSRRLWYLNSRGDSYYFSNIPNLNRMIMEKKELFNEAYREELRSIIEAELGDKFRTYLWPEEGDRIPDNRDLKLVVLGPEDSGDLIPEWMERKGETFREYKNTLFFALADISAFASLREDVKKMLALQEIESEIQSGESQLPDEKRTEVQRELSRIQRDFSYNVRRMYHTLHLGDRQKDLGNPTTGRETLSNWYWRELTSDDVGAILNQLHYRFILNKFFAENDQIATSVLLDQFYKEPNLPAPASQGVVTRAIQLGIKDGAFGLVEVIEGDIDPETLKYKTQLPMDGISYSSGTFLISKERSEILWEKIQISEEAAVPETDEGEKPGQVPIPPEPEEEDEVQPDRPKDTHYQRVRLVVSGIPASKIADVNRGILMPISRSVGDFEFTVEIDVSSAEGISKSTLENQIKETIRQIGGLVDEEEKE